MNLKWNFVKWVLSVIRGNMIGKPSSNGYHTVKELEEMEMVGLYAPNTSLSGKLDSIAQIYANQLARKIISWKFAFARNFPKPVERKILEHFDNM